MPDLPTLTVSQEHFDRLVAVFPGTTSAQKVQAYREWLINRLVERVFAVESLAIEEDLAIARETAHANLRASLPPTFPEQPIQPPMAT